MTCLPRQRPGGGWGLVALVTELLLFPLEHPILEAGALPQARGRQEKVRIAPSG